MSGAENFNDHDGLDDENQFMTGSAPNLPSAWITVAPSVVALLVFVFTIIQWHWQRKLTRSQYWVTVRQVQYELLDRRVRIIDIVTALLGQVSMNLKPTDEQRIQYFKALAEREILFGAAVAADYDAAWEAVIKLHNTGLDPETFGPSMDPTIRARIEANSRERRERFEDVRTRMKSLRSRMIEIARIPE